MMKCPNCGKEDFKSVKRWEDHMIMKCGIPFDIALHLATKHLEDEGTITRPKFAWDMRVRKK